MTDVIFLHGAWHQPAHYAYVAECLRAQGLTVELPDLHMLSLAESVAKVQAVVDDSPRPPVVVGHSFGGLTAGSVTGAAVYVFLTAWVLLANESPGELLAKVRADTGEEPELLATHLDDAGLLHLDPTDARRKLYIGVSDRDAATATALLRPEPPSIFGAAPEAAPWQHGTSVYVAGIQERTIAPSLVDLFASRCSTSLTWPTGHAPHLTHPDDLVQVIIEAAR
ncbi:hypothetical protein Kisp01_70940 [Kineosporia sp. NBRC 101677]|nr:hypothetical protein Kisp01_70940 [Kineosporia sp. NBRC 101677]